jgi:uncharacterized protein (TIGR02001 family)
MPALQGNKAHIRGRLAPMALVLAILASIIDARAGDCGGAIGLASDNIYRGISLGGGKPAWIVDAHCRIGDGWVAGAGAGRVLLAGRRPNLQLGLYVDRHWQFDDDWSAKVGATHYDGARRGRRDGLRYDEINAVLGYKSFWRASVSVSPNASDLYFTNSIPPASDGAGESHWATSVETTFHRPLMDRLAADTGIGVLIPEGKGESSYRYASIGLSYAIGDVSLYASRIWTDSISWEYHYLGQTFVMRQPPHADWVGTIVWTF